MIEISFVEAACIDSLKSTFITVDTELVRGSSDNRTLLFVLLVYCLVFDILVTYIIDP